MPVSRSLRLPRMLGHFLGWSPTRERTYPKLRADNKDSTKSNFPIGRILGSCRHLEDHFGELCGEQAEQRFQLHAHPLPHYAAFYSILLKKINITAAN